MENENDKKTTLTAKAEIRKNDTEIYIEKIQKIMTKLPEIEKQAGKRCSRRITLEKNGLISNAEIKNGNTSLCKRSQEAIRGINAGIPPQKQYQILKNASIKFNLPSETETSKI